MNVLCRTRPSSVPRSWTSFRIPVLLAAMAGIIALGVSAEDRRVRRDAARARVAADTEELSRIARAASEAALHADLAGQFLDMAGRMLPPGAGEEGRRMVEDEREKSQGRCQQDVDAERTRYLTVLARMTRSISQIDALRGNPTAEWATWEVCLEVGRNFRERVACASESAANLVAEVETTIR